MTKPQTDNQGITPPEKRNVGITPPPQTEQTIKLTVDPSAIEFFLESIYGKRPENKKAAKVLHDSLTASNRKARVEELENTLGHFHTYSDGATPLWAQGIKERLKELRKLGSDEVANV